MEAKLPILRSKRAHMQLQLMMKHTGIRGFDSTTPEGAYINELMRQFRDMGAKLPPAAADALAEIIVSAIIIQRSAMSHMIVARGIARSDTELAKAKRQAYAIAINAYKSAADRILNGIKLLNSLTTDETPSSLNAVLKDLLRQNEEGDKTVEAVIDMHPEIEREYIEPPIQEE